MSFNLSRGSEIKIYISENQSEAVFIAARHLITDLSLTMDIKASLVNEKDDAVVRITTQSIDTDDAFFCLHKEAYRLKVLDGNLEIAGADRRGSVYGIYELSKMLGVSPWYFFADVPIKQRDSFVLRDDFVLEEYPTVEYRGIFINDEEELEKWAKKYFGEATIGIKAYEKIFELLLRLRGNYIWPAMHVNSFNMQPESGQLADRMGIVVGTSHCDMLMRSNNREWRPWLEKKGYKDVSYDYSIPGRNRDVLDEYWRESVEQNQELEVSYTLGMRGIHDSGFEVEAFADLKGEELLKAKINLLETVISAQRGILKDTLGEKRFNETLKTFVPYKEVLPLYDGGLNVPEDMTLIWANDNYGYIRRYPSKAERTRSGGNGIYYHNSYWAAPGASYLFICSTPLAHTRYELTKAFDEGIRKLWVLNVGAIKPLEMQISYYLDLAWNIGKEDKEESLDSVVWTTEWLLDQFDVPYDFANVLACKLTEFDQIVNVRKIELLDSDVFSQTAYGNEAADRINRLREIFDVVNSSMECLSEKEKDSFFELVGLKVHAAYLSNLMYYYADRSADMVKRGKSALALEYVKKTRETEDNRRRLIEYYNYVMADGKWDGMVTPEDFPPPRTAMYPACVPPLKKEDESLDESNIDIIPKRGADYSFEADGILKIRWIDVGWDTVYHLGRDRGELYSVYEEGDELKGIFTLTEDCAEPLLEIFRFPSLNSVGRIRVKVIVDGDFEAVVESESNDEHRGNWNRNIRDNVDKLYLALPELKVGLHSITFVGIDSYFALSSAFIYTKERRENNLGLIETPDYSLPAEIGKGDFVYGELIIPKRKDIWGPVYTKENSLPDLDTYLDIEEGEISIDEIIASGESEFVEKDGRVIIDAAAALAESRYAHSSGRSWDYCSSESYNRTGIALHIRKPGLVFNQDLPALHYMVNVAGGKYRLWILMKYSGANDTSLRASMFYQGSDSCILGEKKNLFRYSGEQVWRWSFVEDYELVAGQYELMIELTTSGMRIDRLLLERL